MEIIDGERIAEPGQGQRQGQGQGQAGEAAPSPAAAPGWLDDPWWVKWPDLLEAEIASLRALNVEPEVDLPKRPDGVVRLRFNYTSNGRALSLAVVYPDAYPYFRFEVYAEGECFARHQNPLHKNLCLLERSTAAWQIGDTVGSLLQQQIPKLLETADNVAGPIHQDAEDAQAEPVSVYYSYVPCAVLIDGRWTLPDDVRCGELKIALDAPRRSWGGSPLLPVLQGAVLEVRDDDGNTLMRGPEAWAKRFRGHVVTARWVRADKPILTDDEEEFREAIEGLDRSGARNLGLQFGSLAVRIWGVIFPEERVAKQQIGQGWVFLVQFQGSVGAKPSVPAQLPAKFAAPPRPAKPGKRRHR